MVESCRAHHHQNMREETHAFCLNPSMLSYFSSLFSVLAILSLFAIILSIWIDHGATTTMLHDVYSNMHNSQVKMKRIQELLNQSQDLQNNLTQQMGNLASSIPQLLSSNDGITKALCDHKAVLNEEIKPIIGQVYAFITEKLQSCNDNIERADYALANTGGRILSVRNTKSYNKESAHLNFFGIKFCDIKNAPDFIIQAGMLPGECWAFHGSSGAAVIKLIRSIKITGITLQHITEFLSPTGDISSAPKLFSLWGLKDVDDKNGFFYGQFVYDVKGKDVQHFLVQHSSSQSFPIAEVKFQSNHGNQNYTCVYRVRIHGEPENFQQ